MTNPGATRRQLQPVESAKEPDAITRKTPSKAQHLCPSRAPHKSRKRRRRRKRRKGECKIVKEFYIYIKQHLVEFKNINLEKIKDFAEKNKIPSRLNILCFLLFLLPVKPEYFINLWWWNLDVSEASPQFFWEKYREFNRLFRTVGQTLIFTRATTQMINSLVFKNQQVCFILTQNFMLNNWDLFGSTQVYLKRHWSSTATWN